MTKLLDAFSKTILNFEAFSKSQGQAYAYINSKDTTGFVCNLHEGSAHNQMTLNAAYKEVLDGLEDILNNVQEVACFHEENFSFILEMTRGKINMILCGVLMSPGNAKQCIKRLEKTITLLKKLPSGESKKFSYDGKIFYANDPASLILFHSAIKTQSLRGAVAKGDIYQIIDKDIVNETIQNMLTKMKDIS